MPSQVFSPSTLAAFPSLIKDAPSDLAPPRLSVCLPTYNGEAYIAEAVQSVLQQSYSAFEIVAVDDVSTDRTLEILREFADPRVRIYQNPCRKGIPGNWNVAVALARGEYVCLFHQDDVMLADNLARKMAFFESDPSLSLVHSLASPLIESDAPSRLGDWMEKADTDFVEEGEVYFRKLLLRGNCICAPTVLVQRTQLETVGGFNEALGYACDYEMWMKLCAEGRVGFIHDALVGYRWHAGNASHRYQHQRGVRECRLAVRAAVAYYTAHREDASNIQLLAETVHSWRTGLYLFLRRLLRPAYTALLRRNHSWLLSVKNRLKQHLLREEIP